jgi:hypothetical protein
MEAKRSEKGCMTSTTSPSKTLVRPRRSASITIHLSPDEKRAVDRAAFEADEGTSHFARKLILKALKAKPNGSE